MVRLAQATKLSRQQGFKNRLGMSKAGHIDAAAQLLIRQEDERTAVVALRNSADGFHGRRSARRPLPVNCHLFSAKAP